jgi:prepilin-type processing-associated H-X9-DG protein
MTTMSTGAGQANTVFYDGHCGLCHHAVKFVLKHDRDGASFRFAPLQGDTFKNRVGPDRLANLPDSMIVQTPDGSLLMRSNAWIHVLRELGGGWGMAAKLLHLIPRPLRDTAYNGIALVRRHFFRRPDRECPVIPADLRERFDR